MKRLLSVAVLIRATAVPCPSLARHWAIRTCTVVNLFGVCVAHACMSSHSRMSLQCGVGHPVATYHQQHVWFAILWPPITGNMSVPYILVHAYS
jgi:hypothetical protein